MKRIIRKWLGLNDTHNLFSIIGYSRVDEDNFIELIGLPINKGDTLMVGESKYLVLETGVKVTPLFEPKKPEIKVKR